MKYIIALVCAVCLYTSCAEKEVLYWTHMYGFAKIENTEVGVNGLILTIGDIDPEDIAVTRTRNVQTANSPDSAPGFFEMDSVCFATSASQGSHIVWILLNSENNPGYITQSEFVDPEGPVDTFDFFIDITP